MWGISWLAAKPVSFSRRPLLHGVSKQAEVGRVPRKEAASPTIKSGTTRVRIRRVNHSNVNFELIKQLPSNAVFSASKIKNSLWVTTIFNHPSYTITTQRHRHAKNITQRNWRGGGRVKTYQHLPILFTYEDRFLDHLAMLPHLLWWRRL